MCVYAHVSVLICTCVCMCMYSCVCLFVCVHKKTFLSSGYQTHALRMISKHSAMISSQLHEHLNLKGGNMVEHDPIQTSVVSLLITSWYKII